MSLQDLECWFPEKKNSTSRFKRLSNDWEYADYGSSETLVLPRASQTHSLLEDKHHKPLMDQYRATSIAGNDLIASIFYTIGTVISIAGIWSPISLLLVAAAMFPYQHIITEVCTALPLNGGAYSVMLNAATKTAACIVGTICILDFMATSVVSAASAMAYLSAETVLPSWLSIFSLTVAVLVLFALISLLGMKESTILSLVIFCFHTVTISTLIVISLYKWTQMGNNQLIENFKTDSGEDVPLRIFYGFCIGLLSQTGFECAGDYIEECKPGVFPKVMRNLWVMISAINAPLCLMILVFLPTSVASDQSDIVVSLLAETVMGGSRWLRIWVSIDAVVVQCAGVLAGFVAVEGLMQRMALDRIIPGVFLAQNDYTGCYYVIVLSFLALCIGMYSIVGGDASSISAMFVVAFLGCMCSFAVCNLMLKYKRGKLQRTVVVSVSVVVVSLGVLVLGLIGNIVLQPSVFLFFFAYFMVIFLFVLLLLNRVTMLKILYWCFDQLEGNATDNWSAWIEKSISGLRDQPVVFFTTTDDMCLLNKAILYTKQNEMTNCIKFVHFYDDERDIPQNLEANRKCLDRTYPKIKVDLILIPDEFSPEAVEKLSEAIDVPPSLMFMRCPGDDFRYPISEFDGIRTITL